MPQKLPRNQTLTKLFIISILIVSVTLTMNTLKVAAQTEPTVTVTGATGTTQTYTLTQLQAMQSISNYGGFYQTNPRIGNSGLWTGISVLYLCNQAGGITQNSNITVTGQGSNSFTYEMISSGTHFNDLYKTYDNITGAERNQTQLVTLILAYMVNGTTLPSNSLPAPRLVVVGSEGLLMDGSGGRSVTQISIINLAPSRTPTPTPSPTPTPTISPTPIQTPSQTAKPTPTASPTAIPTATPTPTASPTTTTNPTPIPTNSSTNHWPITYTVTIVAIVVMFIVALAVVFLRKK